MRDTIASICTYIIEYTFYAIFLTVPFAFTGSTSELFEFNKMWLTFVYVLIIGAAWFSKMIVQKRFFIQKTPLDIPIGLFLLSQIISTLFSMDIHISLWGYYSRFNGGLLSMISYIFLYYAFVSNFFPTTLYEEISQNYKKVKKVTRNILIVSLIAGLGVALWGLPSHFGYDPTCLIFRGTFDVSCWTDQFQPKIRIFSTLGQPNWLAAYLAVLLPLSLAYGLTALQKNKNVLLTAFYFLLTILFYVDILYTDSQSGFLGTVGALGVFLLGYIFIYKKEYTLTKSLTKPLSIGVICLLITFFIGLPISQLRGFTFAGLSEKLASTTSQTKSKTSTTAPAAGTALEGGSNGGSNSGDIRKYVWTGAIDAWKDNPIFGTGVETFAFAYYKYRPTGHNMTSEWDYLYNKAHNEYLNYLATTGAFGLLSYLAIICMFLWITSKYFLRQSSIGNHQSLLILALLAGYVSILISNFFGFSVVLLNIYLFIIPAFALILAEKLKPNHGFSRIGATPWGYMAGPFIFKNKQGKENNDLNGLQWTQILIINCIALWGIFSLIQFWRADNAFALAQNLNHVGQYNEGAKLIREAVALRDDEPTFKEELATSDASIAVALAQQKQTQVASQLAAESIQVITGLTTDYPNNINFLKSQVRVYYTLGSLNPTYMQQALLTMQKTALLAPTDAKISYNLGVLYGQTGNTQKGIDVLQETIKLKPDYYDAYYALGLFYHDAAMDKTGKKIIHPEMEQKAVDEMHYVYDRFGHNKTALDSLKSWGEK